MTFGTTTPGEIKGQIERNFDGLRSSSHFGRDHIWLTLYVAGEPRRLEIFAQRLRIEGWVNLSDWDGGFLYPKMEIENRLDQAVSTALAASDLTLAYEVELIAVDADTSPDVAKSKFLALYQASLGSTP